MRTFLSSVKNRVYLYSIEGAILGVLTFYGFIDVKATPIWLLLGASILGIGTSTLSVANARNPEPGQDVGPDAEPGDHVAP